MLLTPKRPRSVDQAANLPAAPEAALPRPGSEPVSVKEEPLVLEDGDSDLYGGPGRGENSSSSGVMPLLGEADAPHMGFLAGAPAHPQAHEFQDEGEPYAVWGRAAGVGWMEYGQMDRICSVTVKFAVTLFAVVAFW